MKGADRHIPHIIRKLYVNKKMGKYYETFYGHKVSEHALEHGRLDYGTLAKCFDCVLCNNIVDVDPSIFDNVESGEFTSYYKNGEEITREQYEEETEQIQAAIDDLEIEEWETEEQERIAQNHIKQLEEHLTDYEELNSEIFQYFIVSDNALYLLKEANELVFYSELLDVYIWAVCHYGTSWDYVLTRIELKEKENA